MANGGIYYWHPLLPQLERLGLEFDQRMQQAWDASACKFVSEVMLLTTLKKLNARGLECLPDNWLAVCHEFRNRRTPGILNAFPDCDPCHPRYAEIAAPFTFPYWMKAIEFAGETKTIGCHHFCSAIAHCLLKPWDGEPANTPPLITYLASCHGERGDIDEPGFFRDGIPRMLQKMPKTRQTIEALGRLAPQPDDFQYALCLEEGQVVVRTVSVLDDFVVRSAPETHIPARALLTHFKEQFGAFTAEEIAALEEMIRNPKARERDFQAFFEGHPHFFRRWDYREVHPQVYLVRQDEGPLVPDFVLTNPEIQQATIVELKLPSPKLIVHHDNRVRFAAAIHEARSQLLEYREWFQQKANRQRLVGKLGMEVYEPRLAVIIGRSAEFQCALEREKLGGRTPDVEVVTYDDIICYAKRRRMLMGE